MRWVIVAAAIAFLAHTLIGHWAEVTAIRFRANGLFLVSAALVTTLAAHGWSGWVWGWILQALQQPVTSTWSTPVYLKTNLLKYLPGNVWHFYGRIHALEEIQIDRIPAVVAVVLEPLLMAAAALLLGLTSPTRFWLGQVIVLAFVIGGIHPRWLNPFMNWLGNKTTQEKRRHSQPLYPAEIRRYPLKPLVGAVIFIFLRGIGFALVISAFYPLPAELWPSVVSLFSLAWLAGLAIPGAPGGLGVFEAMAVTLMQDSLSVEVVLSAVALYRLTTTLAEAAGAGLAVLGQQAIS